MMLAIFGGRVFRLGDDLNQARLLDYETNDEVLRVPYDADTLIVDPTDAQVEAAERGDEIPPESCAVCHDNPHHEHEWHYRTRDGYGVCDACGTKERHG